MFLCFSSDFPETSAHRLSSNQMAYMYGLSGGVPLTQKAARTGARLQVKIVKNQHKITRDSKPSTTNA